MASKRKPKKKPRAVRANPRKLYRISGSVTIRTGWTWTGELDEDEQALLKDWYRLADSGLPEDAITRAISEGQYDIDPADIEIDDVREVEP